MIVVAMVLMTLGTAFVLAAAIGVIRLRDPLQRMHSATKAGTLGTALLVLGALLTGTIDRTGTGLLTLIFLLITLPLVAQVLARASYVSGSKLEGIDSDPLDGELDRTDETLR